MNEREKKKYMREQAKKERIEEDLRSERLLLEEINLTKNKVGHGGVRDL